MRQLVFVSSKRGTHLRHIGIALLPHLSHHLSLTEQFTALIALLGGLADGALAIHEVHVSLIDLQRHVVLLSPYAAAPHCLVNLGKPQIVVSLQAVEYGQRRLQSVTIIECAHIGVGIGGRVDGATEIHLSVHGTVDARKERADGLCLRRTAVLKGELLLAHAVTVVGGILHAALHGPRL